LKSYWNVVATVAVDKVTVVTLLRVIERVRQDYVLCWLVFIVMKPFENYSCLRCDLNINFEGNIIYILMALTEDSYR
jgi:hypothetical protein